MPAAGTGKNREALMEAAIECLQRRGYARTTSRDLAATAGSNLAAITYHYGSKEELLNQALVEGFRRWGAAVAAEVLTSAESDPLRMLGKLAGEVETSFERNRGLARSFVEAVAEMEHSKLLRRHLASSYEELRRGFGGLFCQVLPGSEPYSRALASAIIAVFDGLLIQWLIDPERTPRAAEILAALGAASADLARGAKTRQPA
jgi:AcrR family transcriptional regulator